jgi:hypothetical protein
MARCSLSCCRLLHGCLCRRVCRGLLGWCSTCSVIRDLLATFIDVAACAWPTSTKACALTCSALTCMCCLHRYLYFTCTICKYHGVAGERILDAHLSLHCVRDTHRSYKELLVIISMRTSRVAECYQDNSAGSNYLCDEAYCAVYTETVEWPRIKEELLVLLAGIM